MILRVVVLALVALGVFAWLTRSPWARQAIRTLLAILAVYAILKAAGVIEAIAPKRDGF